MLLAILTVWFWQRTSSPQIESEENDVLTEVVLSGLPQILERWQEGDREGKFQKSSWACGDFPFSENVAPAFLRCQPRYLECWARGEAGVPESLSVSLGNKQYKIRLKKSFPAESWLGEGERYTRWVTRSDLGVTGIPNAGVLVDIEVEGVGHWPLILEDTCRDTYLPERIYSYGPRPERDTRPLEMVWDNLGRKIFIDKFLVTNADVGLWQKKKIKPEVLALPALDLSIKEQEAFCAWRGARRMEAHLWDAASMTPPDINRPLPEFIVKPWLPWTRDRRGTFFEKALKDRDWKPTAVDCGLAYVKECNGVAPYRPYHSDNVSWMGIFHILGGEPERLRNTVEPSLVIKGSHRYLSAKDTTHQLGIRLKDREAAAFRCYREVFP